MTLAEKLKSMPNVCRLIMHYLEAHAPSPGSEPVTLPRPIFDALVMAALVGLDAIDELPAFSPGGATES